MRVIEEHKVNFAYDSSWLSIFRVHKGQPQGGDKVIGEKVRPLKIPL